MAKLYNRVKMTVSGTPGTGTITLLAAVSNAFMTFAEAGVSNADVVAYLIEDGTDFEIGIGTYTTSGTTLSRDTVTKSKIAGTSGTTKLTLTSAAVVYITARKEDLLSASETQTANQLYGGPSSGGAAAPAFRALVAADLPAGTTPSAATQAELEAASSTTVYTSPGRQHFHPSAAKVWTSWGVTSTILASYNTSSVTDTGTGDWTVNFTTAFSSTTYSPHYTVENDGSSVRNNEGVQSKTASSARCTVYSIGGLADPTVGNSFAAYGDQ